MKLGLANLMFNDRDSAGLFIFSNQINDAYALNAI